MGVGPSVSSTQSVTQKSLRYPDKVRKVGNSLGVVLPKEVVSRLRTRAGAPLFLIEAPDGGYQLTPYDPAFERKLAKVEELIGRYRNTLHVLAKR